MSAPKNARAVIDAAPLMLEALEKLLPFLPDRNDVLNNAAVNEGRASTFHLAALQARQAVARAKEESF